MDLAVGEGVADGEDHPVHPIVDQIGFRSWSVARGAAVKKSAASSQEIRSNRVPLRLRDTVVHGEGIGTHGRTGHDTLELLPPAIVESVHLSGNPIGGSGVGQRQKRLASKKHSFCGEAVSTEVVAAARGNSNSNRFEIRPCLHALGR